MNYGKALEAIKKGKLAQRKGWNGKGMFIFQRPSDSIPIDVVVEKVKSLPEDVKGYFSMCDIEMVHFSAYLCMKGANDEIINGWLASQTDMLAEDWIVL